MPTLHLSRPLASWRSDIYPSWRLFMLAHKFRANARKLRRESEEARAETAANPYNWGIVP